MLALCLEQQFVQRWWERRCVVTSQEFGCFGFRFGARCAELRVAAAPCSPWWLPSTWNNQLRIQGQTYGLPRVPDSRCLSFSRDI